MLDFFSRITKFGLDMAVGMTGVVLIGCVDDDHNGAVVENSIDDDDSDHDGGGLRGPFHSSLVAGSCMLTTLYLRFCVENLNGSSSKSSSLFERGRL
jgi:hypothetical protein